MLSLFPETSYSMIMLSLHDYRRLIQVSIWQAVALNRRPIHSMQKVIQSSVAQGSGSKQVRVRNNFAPSF